MRRGKLVLLFLCIIFQNIVCMDEFVQRALIFEKSGELERELLDAKFDMMMYDFEEYHRRSMEQELIDVAIDTIEKGLCAKETWQLGEVESLFSALFSAKLPDETVEEAIKRFWQS